MQDGKADSSVVAARLIGMTRVADLDGSASSRALSKRDPGSASRSRLEYNRRFPFMSTMAEIGTPPRRRYSLVRLLCCVLLAVVLVGIGGVGYGYHVAQAALPQLDGRVELPGLSG